MRWAIRLEKDAIAQGRQRWYWRVTRFAPYPLHLTTARAHIHVSGTARTRWGAILRIIHTINTAPRRNEE